MFCESCQNGGMCELTQPLQISTPYDPFQIRFQSHCAAIRQMFGLQTLCISPGAIAYLICMRGFLDLRPVEWYSRDPLNQLNTPPGMRKKRGNVLTLYPRLFSMLGFDWQGVMDKAYCRDTGFGCSCNSSSFKVDTPSFVVPSEAFCTRSILVASAPPPIPYPWTHSNLNGLQMLTTVLLILAKMAESALVWRIPTFVRAQLDTLETTVRPVCHVCRLGWIHVVSGLLDVRRDEALLGLAGSGRI